MPLSTQPLTDNQRRNHCIAGSGVVGKHHMPRFFAADIGAVPFHFLNHITLAHAGTHTVNPLRLQKTVQRRIGNNRCHHCISFEARFAFQILSQKGDNLIPVQANAFFVTDNYPVAVAVHGNSQLGMSAAHRLDHFLDMLRTAVSVNVPAVRLIAYGNYPGTEFHKHLGHNL